MQFTLGRLLQVVGLTIPPIAMYLQLQPIPAISAGQMLASLLASVCVFTIGYYLAAYAPKG